MKKQMQQALPLISIIISNLNGSKTLQQCIDSVSNQTYKHKELIIIDGGSKDDSIDLLIKNDCKITYWISESDNGIYSAWNKGLTKATGDWICFLGSDDYFWDDQVLEITGRALNTLPYSIKVAYGQVMLLTEECEPLYSIGKPWEQSKNQFTKYMSIPHPGLMHRRSLFELNGNFDESFKIAGDYEFLLRELKKNEAAFLPLLFTGVRQGGISSNSDHSMALLGEIRRAQFNNGFYIPSFSWALALIRLLIRKIFYFFLGEQKARLLLDVGRRMIGLPKYWSKL